MPKPQPIVMEGSPVVRALEDAWATIRHHHPELPEVFIVVGAGSGTKQHLRHRHPAAMGWQRDDQRLSVDGDGLNRGAVVVLGTLLHEATHALAQVRNINDTSRRGRHNRRFAKLAEELGLEHDRRLGSIVVHADDRQHRSVPYGPRQPGPSIAHLPPPAIHWRRQHDIIGQPRGLRLRWWPTHPGVANHPRRRSDRLPGLR